MLALISYYFLFLTLPFFNPQKSVDADNPADTDKIIKLADPTIFYYNKTYYLYGTGSKPHQEGFVVYTSADLKKWSGPVGVDNGYAMKKGNAFGDAKFWAPQVFRHGSWFYMAYTANERIAIAKSKSPLGPFVNESKLPIEDKKQIDPFVFFDGDKIYMYHVVVANGANRIFVVELNDDLSAVKSNTLKECISYTDRWENTGNDEWAVTEGPTVLKRDGLYYLLYSANDFRSVDYAVGYATSTSPTGPWKKYSGNPIISKQHTKYNGSGHGDLFKDRQGNYKYVMHTHFSNTTVAPRLTGIIDINFKDKNISSVAESFNYLKVEASQQNK